MTRVREILLMIMTAAIIFFGWQNLDSVPVVFLIWRFNLPVALIALVPLLAGLLAGSLLTAVTIRSRRRRRASEEAEEEEEVEGALLEAPADDYEEESEDLEEASIPVEKKKPKEEV